MNLFIVGLGNPGRTNNPHNAGHRVIDHMLRILYPDNYFFTNNIKVSAHKTDMLMNSSGAYIKRLTTNAHITDLWIIHDDLEVQLGAVKWKYGGGAAGHNGLRSINNIYGINYGRIRVGVGRPNDSRIPISHFVTSDHNPEDFATITQTETQLAKFIIDSINLLYDRDLSQLRSFLH